MTWSCDSRPSQCTVWSISTGIKVDNAYRNRRPQASQVLALVREVNSLQPNDAMVSHKPIRIYMGVLILGVIILHAGISASLSCFLWAGKG